MPRKQRLQYEGAFYHIYDRGDGRKRLFFDDDDYREFEELLLDLAGRLSINVYSWCLMPNHFHLLIETPLANLSAFMQRLLTRYAMSFNRRYHRSGHVFQGRFEARHCDKEAYLLQLVRYIHLNPYQAKSLEVPPGGWPWSSHRYYMGGDEPGVARPFIQDVLRRFSDEIAQARGRFELFVAEGLKGKEGSRFYQPKGKRFLGSDRFITEMRQKAKELVRERFRPGKRDLKTVMSLVEARCDVSGERMCSRSRDPRTAAARRVFAGLARQLWRYPAKEIAAYLRQDATAVSHWIRRIEIEGNQDFDALRQALLSDGG